MISLTLLRRATAVPTDQLVWGTDYASRPATVRLGVGHILVAGSTGAGKSTVLNAILAAAAPRRDVCIVGIDPKRVELSPWAPRLAALGRTHEEISAVLEWLLLLMHGRYSWLEARGLRDWDSAYGVGGRVLVPIDELAAIFRLDAVAREERGRKATGAGSWRNQLEELAAMGRAAGIVLVSCTQRPAADVIGDEFRANHGQRLCLRVLSEYVARMVFGDLPEGVEPWLIPASKPGTVEMLIDGGQTIRARAIYYGDAAVRRVAAMSAHVRPMAGTLPELVKAVER